MADRDHQPLSIECPICGLVTRLKSDRSLANLPLVCPLDHPIPIADIPGLAEVLAWLRDMTRTVQPEPG